MTFKEAQKHVRDYTGGAIVLARIVETDEYVVRHAAKRTQNDGYFTDDLDDAVETAKCEYNAMVERAERAKMIASAERAQGVE